MPASSSHFDVIILGAGAAGLFCAGIAARRGRSTLVLDHNDRPGRKLLISGGGRCNFTNTGTTYENFLSSNPNFARSALARYTPDDFIALVRQHNIAFHEKTLGQLFCDSSAQQILSLLLHECAAAELRTSTTLRAVRPNPEPSPNLQSPARFLLETSSGPLSCSSLVIATGGLSIPKLGATALGYDLARQFGLPLIDTRPALVPLTLTPSDLATWTDLAGLSATVVATASGPASNSSRNARPTPFREKALLTHRGLSGPAILQISSFWRPGTPVTLDLLPDTPTLLAPLLARSSGRDLPTLLALLRPYLPLRLAERLLSQYLQGFSNRDLLALEHTLHHWQFHPDGTEGFPKAEVTAGGVDTRALDPRTLEARAVPGLFFIGEVVDVTGWLGGYNFQWAWASAFAAAQAA